MNKRIIELFRLCLKAKEVGIDAFFDYSPHVDKITVRVHENGWDYVKDENGDYLLDVNGDEISPDYDKRFYFDAYDKETINEVLAYLVNLISDKEKAPQGLASE